MYTIDELNNMQIEELLLLCREIKKNIIPMFSTIKKYQLIEFMLQFQEYLNDMDEEN